MSLKRLPLVGAEAGFGVNAALPQLVVPGSVVNFRTDPMRVVVVVDEVVVVVCVVVVVDDVVVVVGTVVVVVVVV